MSDFSSRELGIVTPAYLSTGELVVELMLISILNFYYNE
jgi:hypothetical protein